MKKKLVVGVVMTIGVCASAVAATKCIKLNENVTCLGSSNGYRMGWDATCAGIKVEGIAVCTPESATEQFATEAYSFGMGTDASKLVNCWCRVVRPAVSDYVFLQTFGSAYECLWKCSRDCDNRISDNANYRRALFSTMK